MTRVSYVLAAVFSLALLAACGGPSAPTRLESVAPLAPPSLPPWITQIAPLGQSNSPQIRVIFAKPVVPVEQLGTAGEKAVLSHFSLAPAISGAFIVLTPRMVAFQPAALLPASTRVRVTISAGLHDLASDRLDRDLAWTFNTAALKVDFTYDNPNAGSTVTLRPRLQITSNGELDLASFSEVAAFTSDPITSGGAVPAVASPEPRDSSAPADEWTYDVVPQNDLRKDTRYTFRMASGVRPAQGNLPAETTLWIPLHTYGNLAFEAARPTADPYTPTNGNPRFAPGDPVLVFNNALDPATFAQHVSISPSPRPAGKLFSLSYDENAIGINPYALAPRTRYVANVDPQLTDIYGQKLGRAVQTAFTTGAVTPAFWAPSGANTFVSGANLQLQYSAVNLPGNAYQAAYAPVDPAQLVANDIGDIPANTLGKPQTWKQFVVAQTPDRETAIDVPLQRLLGAVSGTLAYGAIASVPKANPFYGAVQLTNIGIFAQWFPQSARIMVQRLSDGLPMPGAGVDVYISRTFSDTRSAGAPVPCATAATDVTGTMELSGPGLAACYAGNRPAGEAPELLVVARSGSDWSYVRTFSWSGVYQYATGDIAADWNTQPISRGTIYSDRQLYQPSERVWLTAVCYVLKNGALLADRNAVYKLSLRDPRGKSRDLPEQTTNGYATFSFPLDLSRSQPLGYYTVIAKSPDGVEITGNFRVAEFRPPNFSVDLSLDRNAASVGQTIHASGRAHYLFGAPMSGATASLHVTRQQTTFSPKGWETFTFGRQWFWPETSPDVSSDVMQKTLTLDSQGKGSAEIAVGSDLPYPMTYRVDLDVSDVTRLASSSTQTFLALPAQSAIGLQSDFVGTVGSPIGVSVIVTDAQGKAQTATRVHVELQKMQYSGVTQIVEGGESARNQVQYTTVASADVTSAATPQSVQLVPKDSGSYRIRANFSGSSNDAGATDTQVWVTGPGQAYWGQENASQLQLKLDRAQYAIGQTAMVAVASPYDRADLYLYVVRDRVLYRTLVHVNGNAPRVRIPVAAEMFPNAAVEGVLVRRGPPLSRSRLQSLDSLVRIGIVALSLDLSARYLKVSVQPGQPKIAPGAHQHVRLLLRDAAGKPLQGQFTVMVVNDAVLQLSGYRPPDLVKTVFEAQPIATRFGDNRPNVTLLQPSLRGLEKGWGFGGGFLAGAAGTRVRTQFLPLAYFNGSVVTDRNGSADVAFTLPDNLTTWRVMAVAVGAGSSPRFGSSDATFITTKPLVTEALLPQFARPGDEIDAGLQLMNASSSSVNARTQGDLSGPLRFASGAPALVQAQLNFGPGMNAWRFPMLAGAPGQAWMQFRTVLSSGESDAFREQLQVRANDTTESVIDAGSTRDRVQIPLSFSGSGNVQVEIAGSILPQVVLPARRALEAERLPFASSIADRLSIATSVLAIQQRLGTRVSAVDAGSEAASAIGQLAPLQRSDGGFAFWPGADFSDPFLTADAAASLARARDAGIAVPASILVAAKPYLVGALADPQSVAKWCDDSICKASLRLGMLSALAAMGDRRSEFLETIYESRDLLSVAERANLAVYLQQTPGWQSQADRISRELTNNAYFTGRYLNIQMQGPWWSGSLVEAQAAYLRLLSLRGAPIDDRDRALRALLAQRCRCGWASLDDTARALEAIVAYAAEEGAPPNFTAGVELDGKSVATARFTGYAASRTVTLSHISNGRHTVTLRKSGAGTLRYVMTYAYNLSSDAPGRLAGLRVQRTVRAANQPEVLATVDLAARLQQLSFAGGNVYDVSVDVITDHPIDHVIIEDPLPAGFEAVDTSFLTTPAYFQPIASDWRIDYQQIYRDRVTAFAEHLDPGVYTMHYLARSITPGVFLWPGAHAYLLEAPEEFGRSAFRKVAISS